MKSILNHIVELNQQDWDYYSILENRHLDNPFTENVSHTDFIKKYFIRGGKIDVLEQISIDIDSLRHPSHTNSIFFLGILVYFKTYFIKKLKLGSKPIERSNFPFIWFLTSLFHDYAYQIKKAKDIIDETPNLSSLKAKYCISHNLLDKNILNIVTQLLSCCENYFKYRRQEINAIDHGIFAGIYLYDKLIKIRDLKSQKNEDDLFWGKSLEKQYALASSAIAAHNIWMPRKEQIETYKKNNLESLIKFKPLKIKDFPLLYLLGIVDTIDPIKTFIKGEDNLDEEYISENNIDAEYILENIKIEFKSNSIIFSQSSESKLDFKKLIKKSNDYYEWLDVKITYSNNLLEIKFI